MNVAVQVRLDGADLADLDELVAEQQAAAPAAAVSRASVLRYLLRDKMTARRAPKGKAKR